ncbi:MAG TPA: T9SS type A sorting domain-containing protein [Bacteroidales bacterium]|nr:T9SS type A sorting domain-containing protein [Bacteroidales bacterium]
MKPLLKILFLLMFSCFASNFAPAQINVGDTMSFRSVTYIDWPPLAGTPQRTVHAVCDRVGEHCYIFRENTLSPFPLQQIDTLVHRFDYHFVPELTTVYGPMPDALDADTHVFILIFEEQDWCGYWDPAQQMTDSMVFATWGSHSNEHEIIYIASDCFYSAPSITAHEFGHMLHWGRDHSPEPPANPDKYWEDAWIDEGFSTFAQIFLTENIFVPDIQDQQTFFTDNPDIPLIYFSDYNQVKLWTLFMFEHYGGWNYIEALIGNQLNGIAGMDSALRQIGAPATFNEAFLHWSVTNFLDDPGYDNGRYAYHHYNFNPCAITALHNTYPTGICNQSVNPYGTDYVNFQVPVQGSVPTPMSINFSGDSNSKFLLAAIKLSLPGNIVKGIEYLTPDSTGHAVINADSLGEAYDNIVLVVCNVDSSLHEGETASYSYYTSSTAGTEKLDYVPGLQIFPNPVESCIVIKADARFTSNPYTIYNQSGNVVAAGLLDDETTVIDINNLADGVYLFNTGRSNNITFKVIKK